MQCLNYCSIVFVVGICSSECEWTCVHNNKFVFVRHIRLEQPLATTHTDSHLVIHKSQTYITTEWQNCNAIRKLISKKRSFSLSLSATVSFLFFVLMQQCTLCSLELPIQNQNALRTQADFSSLATVFWTRGTSIMVIALLECCCCCCSRSREYNTYDVRTLDIVLFFSILFITRCFGSHRFF